MLTQSVARASFGERRLAVRTQEHARAFAGGGRNAQKRFLDQGLAGGPTRGKLPREDHDGLHLCLVAQCAGPRNRSRFAPQDLTAVGFMVTLISLGRPTHLQGSISTCQFRCVRF